MTIARIHHGWVCQCGTEQEATQTVDRYGPLTPTPDRVTCSACGRTSRLEFDFAPDVGVTVEARLLVPS